MNTCRREAILGIASDAMSDFLYYDRKDSESVKVGEIGDALRAGEVSIDEILSVFRKALEGEAGR